MKVQLVDASLRGQRGDSNEAAVLWRQVGSFPDFTEEDVVGQVHLGWCEVTEPHLGTRKLAVRSTCAVPTRNPTPLEDLEHTMRTSPPCSGLPTSTFDSGSEGDRSGTQPRLS